MIEVKFPLAFSTARPVARCVPCRHVDTGNHGLPDQVRAVATDAREGCRRRAGWLLRCADRVSADHAENCGNGRDYRDPLAPRAAVHPHMIRSAAESNAAESYFRAHPRRPVVVSFTSPGSTARSARRFDAQRIGAPRLDGPRADGRATSCVCGTSGAAHNTRCLPRGRGPRSVACGPPCHPAGGSQTPSTAAGSASTQRGSADRRARHAGGVACPAAVASNRDPCCQSLLHFLTSVFR